MAGPRPSAPRWLFNPAVDVLIGAGAWTVPLLGVTWFASHHAGIDVAFAFSMLTLVCNHPHYMATIHRAYLDRAVIRQHHRSTIHVSVGLAVALVAAHVLPWLRPLIFSAYILWSPWHYTGQNFGLALLFARRRGASPSAQDRQLLLAGFTISYVVWLLAIQSQPSDDPYILSLAIDPVLANGVAAALATLMLSAFAVVSVRMIGRAGVAAAFPTITLCTTQVLWFAVPWMVGLFGAAVAPSVYYATGTLAFMHCAQYLWITTYYARAADVPAAVGARSSLARYACVLVLGGIALFIPGPWMASALAGVDLRESIIIFTAIVNLHHFVFDGVLWKLRDPRVASVLIDGRDDHASETGRAVHVVPVTLRWALALTLLAIAGVDVCQRVLTDEAATSGALTVAHAFNAHDTRVDVRRAALLARAANNDAAIALLQPIVATNPLHTPAQRLLGSLLVADQRWSEATAHYEALARSGGLDAPGYVNLGVLRVQAHDTRGAESAFRRALALDRDFADAHLNLAEALVLQGQAAAAIPHYARYLDVADPRDARSQRVSRIVQRKLAELEASDGDTVGRASAAGLADKPVSPPTRHSGESRNPGG